MRRKLFTLAAAVSLVLCVATVALWVRSNHAFDQINHRSDAGPGVRFSCVYSTCGTIVCATTWAGYEGPSAAERWHNGPKGYRGFEWVSRAPVPLPTTRHGFLWHTSEWRERHAYVQRSKAVGAPHGFFVLLFAVTPSARAFTWWTHRGRRRDNRCPACGYDLRATPDRCPECGAVPEEKKGSDPLGEADPLGEEKKGSDLWCGHVDRDLAKGRAAPGALPIVGSYRRP